VRLMAIGAVFEHGRMFPQKRPASLGVARVAIFIDARLSELRRVGAAVGIVAVGTGHLAFPERHVRRAQELRFSLQMALAADFGLRSLVEERRLISDLGELEAIRGFLHHRVAVDASYAAARVRACVPVGLHTAPMAAKTSFVLDFRGLTRVFAERNHVADALAASGSNMVAAGTVATLASPLLRFVARVEEKNFAHLRLGKFFKLDRVAGFADFVADVSRRPRLRRFFFGARCGLGESD